MILGLLAIMLVLLGTNCILACIYSALCRIDNKLDNLVIELQLLREKR